MENVRKEYPNLDRVKTNKKEDTEKRETEDRMNDFIEVCFNFLIFKSKTFIRFSFTFEFLILETLKL